MQKEREREKKNLNYLQRIEGTRDKLIMNQKRI